MYFMTATQHMPYLDIFVSEHYNVFCRIVWAYDSSEVQSKKMYDSLYEPILMINKSKRLLIPSITRIFLSKQKQELNAN